MQGILNECNTMMAEYLFQTDKHYDIQYDTGDKVIQCGRHNDIFKFWLMWRAKVMYSVSFKLIHVLINRITIARITNETDYVEMFK